MGINITENIKLDSIVSTLLNQVTLKMSMEEIIRFEENYQSLIDFLDGDDGHVSTETVLLNNDFFSEWSKFLEMEKNKHIPMLVAKMAMGDIISLYLYNQVYKGTELEFRAREMLADGTIDIIIQRGMGLNDYSRAVLAAEKWFNSNEAVDLLCPQYDMENALCTGRWVDFSFEMFEGSMLP